jgi:hypothetical protein
MNRLRLLLLNEFKLARTALPVHLVSILQPSLFYLLMSFVLVHPTFDVNIVQPADETGRALVAAMREVGSPIGQPYINPVILPPDQVDDAPLRQIITIESRAGVPTAVQRFGLTDSNQVKNLRNRLTASALRLWNEALDGAAVTVVEHPWLPQDVPYTVYFGMGMLPMTAFLTAVFIGGILTAQDFEFRTIAEYRLAPIAPAWVLAARLTRLVISALLAACALLLVQGWRTGFWPDSVWRVGLILLPVAVVGSGMGVTAGLLLRRSIPTLLIGLVTAMGCWLLGGAFGLPSGFGGLYETVSRLMPNTYAVEMLFRRYYGTDVGDHARSIALLSLSVVIWLAVPVLVYRWRVLRQE